MYSEEEVKAATLEYFKGDQLASDVWTNKYALKDLDGRYVEKTPVDMHRRLAKEFARIEAKYPNPMTEEEIFDLFSGFQWIIPQGSPMAAVGNDYAIMSCGNCFVVDSPLDAYTSIMQTDQELVHLLRRRAGVGIDISNIRPKGMPVKNAAKTTGGIGVFMERFSNTTREVATEGRRGALIITIDVRHPEIETFIKIKRDLKKVTGANISIKVSDAFIDAVKGDLDFELFWPTTAKKDEEKKYKKTVKAKFLFDMMVESNWLSGEPGILHWDNIVRESPADCYTDVGFATHCVNPCGELPLSTDSCRLLLLNSISYVHYPYRDGKESREFDFNGFADNAVKAQRLMDDLCDLEIEKMDKIIAKVKSDPEPYEYKRIEIELWEKMKKSCINGRRTGLGLTAVGDTVAALGYKYGTDRANEFVEKLYAALACASYASSIQMAEERGAFPVFDHDKEKDNPFINRVLDRLVKNHKEYAAKFDLINKYKKFGRRNIANLTTAPCGSISLLAKILKGFGTTSGIESSHLLELKRRRKINPSDKNAKIDFTDEMGDHWQEYIVYHQGYKEWLDANSDKDSKSSPYHGATANEIDWIKGVEMQGMAQKWIDHSISRTQNVPKETTKEQIAEMYLKAFDSGLKGFTVYRDGSRSGVLVSVDDKGITNYPKEIVVMNAPKRPDSLPCDMHTVKVKGEDWVVFVGILNDKPFEIFAGLSASLDLTKAPKYGKIVKQARKTVASRYDVEVGDIVIKDIIKTFSNPDHASLCRLLSCSLRHGTPVKYVIEQLGKDENAAIDSFYKVVARVLKKYVVEGEKSGNKCPQCKEKTLIYKEGCNCCTSCGYSGCS